MTTPVTRSVELDDNMRVVVQQTAPGGRIAIANVGSLSDRPEVANAPDAPADVWVHIIPTPQGKASHNYRDYFLLLSGAGLVIPGDKGDVCMRKAQVGTCWVSIVVTEPE